MTGIIIGITGNEELGMTESGRLGKIESPHSVLSVSRDCRPAQEEFVLKHIAGRVCAE